MDKRLGKAKDDTGPARRILCILQYFYPDVTGFSQMLGDLCLYLNDSGRYNCTVLCGSTVRTTQKRNRLPHWLGSVAIRRIRTLSSGKRTMVHRLLEYSMFYAGVALILLVRRDFDAVVCFSTPPLIGLAATAGLSFSRIPFIYYVQDLYPELLFDMGYVRNRWVIQRLTALNRLIFRRAEGVVTIGRWMAKKLELNYGLRPARLSVVENWAMGVSYSPPPPGGPFVVLYSGNIGLAHDFSFMELLLDRLLTNGASNIEFRFVGAGRQYREVEMMFSRHSFFRCTFSGYVERQQLNALLASASMFLVAQSELSVGDILPSKFYSYLAAGRPLLLLGTRKSEIGEAIVDNDIGIVIECEDDVVPAAENLRRFAARQDDYVAACLGAAQLYQTRMGFRRSAEKVDAILRAVLQA